MYDYLDAYFDAYDYLEEDYDYLEEEVEGDCPDEDNKPLILDMSAKCPSCGCYTSKKDLENNNNVCLCCWLFGGEKDGK